MVMKSEIWASQKNDGIDLNRSWHNDGVEYRSIFQVFKEFVYFAITMVKRLKRYTYMLCALSERLNYINPKSTIQGSAIKTWEKNISMWNLLLFSW